MNTYYIVYRNSHQITHRWVVANTRKEAKALANDIASEKLAVIMIRKLSRKEEKAYQEYEWLFSNSDSSEAFYSLLERVEKALNKYSE